MDELEDLNVLAKFLPLLYANEHFQQAIGMLIGMEDVPVVKQSEYLSSLLTPFCQQV